MTQLAVYVCGAVWWGDPAVGDDGVPIRVHNDGARRLERRNEMGRERRAIADEIGALPEGCVVIHSGAPGAAARAAITASLRHLPVMAVPLTLEADVVVALARAGWTVKVLVFGVDENGEAEAMRQNGVFVRVVRRPPEVESGDASVGSGDEDRDHPQGS